MRIAIDARFWGPQGTGIGCYIENLVRQLEIIDQENEYFILLRKSNYDLYIPQNSHFKKVLADAQHYSVNEQLIIPRILFSLKPDLVHFGHFNIAVLSPYPFVVTLHDMIKHEFHAKSSTTRSLPIYWLKHQMYSFVFQQAVAHAKKVITPSFFVRQKLIDSYKLSQEKVAVTYEAPKEIFKNPQLALLERDDVLKRYEIKKPYIIYVGNVYPYKNVEKLLEAVRLVNAGADPHNLLKLIVVCARSVFYHRLEERVKAMDASSQVVLTGYVPDEDLNVLYQNAESFVFPSLSEGFGITGLEAMACGCPVIASRVSSLPEVYEDAAVYFDPHAEADIAEKIKQVVGNKALQNELIKKGFAQVKKYSWASMAKETLRVYQEVGKK